MDERALWCFVFVCSFKYQKKLAYIRCLKAEGGFIEFFTSRYIRPTLCPCISTSMNTTGLSGWRFFSQLLHCAIFPELSYSQRAQRYRLPWFKGNPALFFQGSAAKMLGCGCGALFKTKNHHRGGSVQASTKEAASSGDEASPGTRGRNGVCRCPQRRRYRARSACYAKSELFSSFLCKDHVCAFSSAVST